MFRMCILYNNLLFCTYVMFTTVLPLPCMLAFTCHHVYISGNKHIHTYIAFRGAELKPVPS